MKNEFSSVGCPGCHPYNVEFWVVTEVQSWFMCTKKINWHYTSFETMADIFTTMPPQDPPLGVMVDNNTTHGKHRRQSKVKFFAQKLQPSEN